MQFNVGKLYEVKKYFWLLYPTKKAAAAGRASSAGDAGTAAAVVQYWSKQLNCRISYIPEKTFLHVSFQKEEFARIISPEGCGWIYVPTYDWINDSFEELTEENCHADR